MTAATKKAKRRAERRSERSKAENPYGHGIDSVQRVVDTIAAMTRRGQLTERQSRAAERYRSAFDAITASLRGTLGKDGVIGGSGAGKTPSKPEMDAARDLNIAAGLLGVLMRVIVEEIVGIGHTIEETANMLHGSGRRASRADRDFIGRSLREALDILADKWLPWSQRSPYRSFMEPGAKPTDTGAETFERAHVAHATARRIFEKNP